MNHDQDYNFAGVAKMVVGFLIVHFILMRMVAIEFETGGMLAGICVGLLAIVAFARSIGVVGRAIGGKDLKWREMPLPIRLIAYFGRIAAGVLLAVFIGRFLWLYVPAALQVIYGGIYGIDLVAMAGSTFEWMLGQAASQIGLIAGPTIGSFGTGTDFSGLSTWFSELPRAVREAAFNGFFFALIAQATVTIWVLANRVDQYRFWNSIGKLKIVEARALFIWHWSQLAAILAVALFHGYSDLVAGLIAGGIGLMVFLMPQISGGLIWFLDMIVQVNWQALRIFPRLRFTLRSQTEPKATSSSANWGDNTPPRKRRQAHRHEAASGARDSDAAYRDACDTLGLPATGFNRAEGVRRWKEAMTASHPDHHGGAGHDARALNAAWETIKRHRGWR